MSGTIEGKLKRLFDFQRFVSEPSLQSVIEDTRTGSDLKRLSEDDLEYVSAGTELPAGGPGNTTTIKFHCKNCGRDFDVELGAKIAQCDNPRCNMIYYLKG